MAVKFSDTFFRGFFVFGFFVNEIKNLTDRRAVKFSDTFSGFFALPCASGSCGFSGHRTKGFESERRQPGTRPHATGAGLRRQKNPSPASAVPRMASEPGSGTPDGASFTKAVPLAVPNPCPE